jgi:multicomponent Na+:H+ antiporter subunit G
MTDIIISFLLIIGALLMLIAAIGIVRMPDLYSRMHAATKSSTMGAGSMYLAVAIFYGELAIITRAILVMSFLFLTIPVSAHMIARAAYFIGEPLWKGTVIDEMRGAYNPVTHELASKRIIENPGRTKLAQDEKVPPPPDDL